MQNVHIAGEAHEDGTWAHFSTVRETQARGNITFQPDEIAGSPFTLSLSAHGTVFSDVVSWTDHDATEKKTLATNVLAHTKFTVNAKSSDGKTDFSGTLTFE